MNDKLKMILFYSFCAFLLLIGVGFMIADYFIKGDWALDTGILTSTAGVGLGLIKSIFDIQRG